MIKQVLRLWTLLRILPSRPVPSLNISAREKEGSSKPWEPTGDDKPEVVLLHTALGRIGVNSGGSPLKDYERMRNARSMSLSFAAMTGKMHSWHRSGPFLASKSPSALFLLLLCKYLQPVQQLTSTHPTEHTQVLPLKLPQIPLSFPLIIFFF